jgi:prepilin-type N-terminal cleavage/methylation domain-containing protein
MTLAPHPRRGGFTLVEVILAIVILAIGLLGLASTAALVTRAIARGQRSDAIAVFAQSVMDEQRLRACSVREDGSRELFRGGAWVARTGWTWSTPSPQTHRLHLATTFRTAAGRERTDVTETTISCIR